MHFTTFRLSQIIASLRVSGLSIFFLDPTFADAVWPQATKFDIAVRPGKSMFIGVSHPQPKWVVVGASNFFGIPYFRPNTLAQKDHIQYGNSIGEWSDAPPA